MKETFGCFIDALDFYKQNAGYPVVVEMDQAARVATLRTGNAAADADSYVVIWPRKDFRGEVEPERVWAEEY